MKTKRQAELVDAFLANLGGDAAPVYSALIDALGVHGYHPNKAGANLTFKHDAHNKQMAKMGIRTGKAPHPFFSLRFSACRDYSDRFGDIVRATIDKYPAKYARCPDGGCSYCAGEPETHIYSYEALDGQRRTQCGAYAMEIPNVTMSDVDEIKRLIGEEHGYLMTYEAGRA